MLIKAEQKNQRQTARKTRLVAEAVKKMPIEQALRQLAVMDRRASLAVLKVLRQAIANAMHNHGLAFADLEIADIRVDEGPTYKRWRAVSRGRAHTILKRTSHIKVELKTKEVPAATAKSEAAAAAKSEVTVKAENKSKAKSVVTEKKTAQAVKKAEPAKKANKTASKEVKNTAAKKAASKKK